MPGIRCAALAIVALAAAPAASAREPKVPQAGPPQLYQQVLDCKAIAEAQARLACYDEKVAALAAATEKREVVITDKAEIRKTRRGLFGFALPIGRLFGGGDDDEEDKQEADELKKLETTVLSTRYSRGGALIITFKEGGTWEQTDSKSFALSPKTGQKAAISRGTLGSYFVSVDGQAGVKMRRIQ